MVPTRFSMAGGPLVLKRFYTMSKEKMTFTEWLSQINFDDYKDEVINDTKCYFKIHLPKSGNPLPNEKVDVRIALGRSVEYSKTIAYGDIRNFINEALDELRKSDEFHPLSEFSLSVADKAVERYNVRDFMYDTYHLDHLQIPYDLLSTYVSKNFGFKVDNKRSKTLSINDLIETLQDKDNAEIYLVCKTKNGQRVYNKQHPYLYSTEISEFSMNRVVEQIARDIYFVIRDKFGSDYDPYCRTNLEYYVPDLSDVYFNELRELDMRESLILCNNHM